MLNPLHQREGGGEGGLLARRALVKGCWGGWEEGAAAMGVFAFRGGASPGESSALLEFLVGG